MADILEKIFAIEKEIKETPYHKGTEHHIGQLKARLAKLKRQLESLRKKGKGVGFALKKSGDATVALVGPPSVGKSTLLNRLTGAHSRVEPWPFTTLRVIPGMLRYKGARIQILDLPGIIGGAAAGSGRGKEVLSVVQAADLLILMVDGETINKVDSLIGEIKKFGIGFEQKPHLVVVNKVDLLTSLPQENRSDWIFLSAKTGKGIDKLQEAIWSKLQLVRVYLKPRGKEPDFEAPLILKKGQTVAEVARKIFPPEKEIRQVLLWGPNSRYPGEQISLTRQLKDEDILTFV